MGADFVHLVLWKEIRQIIEKRASAGRSVMTMTEVAIHGNVNVTIIGKRLTKSNTRKTCGTALNENRCTTSGEQCWNGGRGDEVQLEVEIEVGMDRPYFEGVVRYGELELVPFGLRGTGVLGVS